MSCQVVVKTAPAMQGSYTLVCESPEAREILVKRPDVWWYTFPEWDDMTWKRGGAWDAEVAEAEAVAEQEDLDWYAGEDDADGRW